MDRLIRARCSSETGLWEGEEGARVSFIFGGMFVRKPIVRRRARAQVR